MKATLVIKDLKRLGSSARAKTSARFFKTGKGQYGYGDVFFGVTVPEQRVIAKRYALLPQSEIEVLLKHKVHECRLTALLILVGQYKSGNTAQRERIAKFYIKNARRLNNWDLVDSSAPYILGDYLLDKDRDILYRFVRSQDIWERRISIIATFSFIRRGDYKDTLKIAEMLLADTQDLIHKAVGWMLREVGKKSQRDLEHFLKKHAAVMPRTMLRYAIEKFPENKRRAYLKMRPMGSRLPKKLTNK